MRSFDQPSRPGTVAMFSPTVWCGNRPICWITYPISLRSSRASRCSTLRPPSRMSPPVIEIIRLIRRIAVVLPDPDGPTSTQTSPAGTVNDRSAIAGSRCPG